MNLNHVDVTETDWDQSPIVMKKRGLTWVQKLMKWEILKWEKWYSHGIIKCGGDWHEWMCTELTLTGFISSSHEWCLIRVNLPVAPELLTGARLWLSQYWPWQQPVQTRQLSMELHMDPPSTHLITDPSLIPDHHPYCQLGINQADITQVTRLSWGEFQWNGRSRKTGHPSMTVRDLSQSSVTCHKAAIFPAHSWYVVCVVYSILTAGSPGNVDTAVCRHQTNRPQLPPLNWSPHSNTSNQYEKHH